MNARWRFVSILILHAAAACPLAAADDAHDAAVAAPQAATAPATQSASNATMGQRLARLCEQLETQRESLHIPGMAIAVVKDDKIILARGFGLRDIKGKLPANENTLFAIGSSSKAFTATLIGMLVDEGRMSWDDPVRKYLPDFHLKDPQADAQITIRDLLCHRSGLSRNDMLWYAGTATRQEILQAVANAELFSPFREKFNYNNVMVLAAGESAGSAAGSDWGTLVRSRIFAPLNMARTNATLGAAKADPMLAQGYIWEADKSDYKRLPMRNLGNIAPAGAINSTAIDMAQWVRFQLAKGTVNRRRLISEESLEQTRTKQINVAGDIDYGLGWMLHKWNGRRLVEHGGNIDGFAAEVALLPDDGVGFVLLTNVTATPLQGLAVNIVFDALLGEFKESTPALDLAKVQPYLGKYHFDALKTDVTVLIQNGRLAVDVPGQMVFALKPPDESGKWAFDFPQPISVSFESNDQGQVQQMHLYQAGMEFELPREGITLLAEVDAATAAKYAGSYHFEPRDEQWKVIVHNGRLAVDVPKQMIFDLRLPDADGKWAFRATKAMSVKFNTDDAGQVISLTQSQNGVDSLLVRTQVGSDAPLPTVDELLALRARGSGSDHLAALRNIRLIGTVNFINQGITGAIAITAAGLDQFLQQIDLGHFGYINASFDHGTAYSESAFSEFSEEHGKTALETRLQNPLTFAADWRDTFPTITIVREEESDGRRMILADLKTGEQTTITVHVDAQTGLIARMDTSVTIKGIGSLQTTTAFEDYRDVRGVMLPFRFISQNDASGRMIAQIDTVQTDLDLPADTFTLKPPTASRSSD